MRESSPPEATRRSGAGSDPGFAATKNSIWSDPCRVRFSPSLTESIKTENFAASIPKSARASLMEADNDGTKLMRASLRAAAARSYSLVASSIACARSARSESTAARRLTSRSSSRARAGSSAMPTRCFRAAAKRADKRSSTDASCDGEISIVSANLRSDRVASSTSIRALSRQRATSPKAVSNAISPCALDPASRTTWATFECSLSQRSVINSEQLPKIVCALAKRRCSTSSATCSSSFTAKA